jgi:hypothetical protein
MTRISCAATLSSVADYAKLSAADVRSRPDACRVIHNGAEKAGGGADSRPGGNENIDAKGG